MKSIAAVGLVIMTFSLAISVGLGSKVVNFNRAEFKELDYSKEVVFVGNGTFVDRGNAFSLNCTVFGIPNMNITVEIVKYAHDKYTVWTLEIQDAACDLMSFSSEVELKLHYGPRCGANTYIPEAASKSFTLNMPGVKMDEDKSIFWCQTPLKGRSPKFEMKVRGYDMTLSAPLNLMMGVEAILNCTIKYAKGMEDEVQFVSKVNPNITYSVRQYSDSCKTQPSSDPRFKAVCGENTNDTYSPVKVYSLIITETRMVDRTLWYCHLWNAKSYSPPALLSIRVVHLMGSTRYADLRKDFTFQCVVHYAVNLVDDIKFFKDKTLVGSLFQEMNRCGLSCKEISPRFKLSCGEGTNLVESFNKTYILHVANITADDATAWTCGIANRFVRSNLTTFKLDVTDIILNIKASGVAKRLRTIRIKCMVSHVYGMNYFLDIYKDSTHVAEYKQDVSTCKPKVLTETVAYKAYCLGNTKSLVTDTKTYDLKIMLADKERDEKNWTCGLRGHKYKSPPLQLVIEGFLLTLKVPYNASAKGMPFNFTCVIQNAYGMHDILEFHRYQDLIAYANQTDRSCITHIVGKDPRYSISCKQSPFSSTKSYVLKLKSVEDKDQALWDCQLRQHKVSSNIIKLNIIMEKVIFSPQALKAVRMQTFYFNCTVKFYLNMYDEVQFYRQDLLVGVAVQNESDCIPRQISNLTGYRVLCREGTQHTYSKSKVYLLLINLPSGEDKKEWHCQVRNKHLRSERFKLDITNFTILLKGPLSIVIGRKHALVCVIYNSMYMEDEIRFIRNSQLIASLYQRHDVCTVFYNSVPGYRAYCLSGTNINAWKTKSYKLVIKKATKDDVGAWLCRLDQSGINSKLLRVYLRAKKQKHVRNTLLASSSQGGNNDVISNPYVVAAIVVVGLAGISLCVAVIMYRRSRNKDLTVSSTTHIVGKHADNYAEEYKNSIEEMQS